MSAFVREFVAQPSLFGDIPAKPTDRLFIGLFPDADAIAQINALAHDVCRRHDLRVTPHKPERLHVTLFHVGDWAGLPPDSVDAAIAAAKALQAAPFELSFDEVASFGARSERPPVVLKASAGNATLHALREQLGRELARAGLGRCVSAAFEPHVTLAYAQKAVPAETIAPIRWTARDFVLIHSLLGQTCYVQLGRWPLCG